jgi:hypothetical protein
MGVRYMDENWLTFSFTTKKKLILYCISKCILINITIIWHTTTESNSNDDDNI